MKRLIALPLLILGLAGCETPTVYAPMAHPGSPGYSESRIQADRYRVTFHGGSNADRDRVHDLTLLRAAQLTLQSGYDWFEVVNAYGEAAPPRGPVLSFGGGTGSYGWHGGSSVGVGVGGTPLGGGPTLSETLEILMAKGQPPRQPNAYDAHELAQSIHP